MIDQFRDTDQQYAQISYLAGGAVIAPYLFLLPCTHTLGEPLPTLTWAWPADITQRLKGGPRGACRLLLHFGALRPPPGDSRL